MAIAILYTPPPEETFTPLEIHQSQTPQTFFSSPPVLHFSNKNATLVLPTSQSGTADLPLFSATSSNHEIAAVQNGHPTTEQHVINGADVWVTSESLLLYSPNLSTGLSIPYPTISLHAIQRLRLPGSQLSEPEQQGLYMQLAISSNPGEDEDGSLEVTLIPSITTEQPRLRSSIPASVNMLEPNAVPATAGGAEFPADDSIPTTDDYGPGETDTSRIPLIRQLYEAVSACSDLHPDEDSQPSECDGEDDDGEEEEDPVYYEQGSGESGLPPPFPGSGGWITAENLDQFVDEDGNFTGRRTGGGGAGRVRGREDDGVGDGEEEGVGDGKWRRTG